MMELKRAQSIASTVRIFLRENWFHLLVVFAMLAFPFVVGWVTGSDPMPRRTRDAGESSYWQSVLIQVYIFAILAISYNLMFGFTGVISFGHALFFGAGAYGVGIAVRHLHMNFWIAIAFALVVSALLGLVVGLVSLRIKGVYFAIFTLAFAQIFFILAKNRLLVDVTGAEDGFFFTVPEWLNPTPKNRLVYYFITVAVLALVFLFVRRLVNSPTGRVFQAIRENEDRAKAIGYNTLTYKLISIVFAGMIASMAGILHVILNNKQPLPALLGATYTIDPLLAVLLGGVGTFAGPALGAVVLHLGEEGLRSLKITVGATVLNIGDYWPLALGIAFIVIVMVFPQGLVGTWLRWRSRRRTLKPAHTGSG